MIGKPLRRLIKELVIGSQHRSVYSIKLNRPKGLNALNLSMLQHVQDLVLHCHRSESVQVVLFSGVGDRAFCSGADIRSLYDARTTRPALLSEFFWQEYVCDYVTARMRPVQVCLYDGIVMGGGVGLSVHAPVKVATERTVFAMPETGIGLFPDVAASYFLNQLEEGLGMYLGLSGARLRGYELLKAGLATHYVESDKLQALADALVARVSSETTVAEVNAIVQEFESHPPVEWNPEFQPVFAGVASVAEVYQRLGEAQSDWAQQTLALLKTQCPLSQAVAFKQLQKGKGLSLEAAFAMEYRLSQHFMKGPDFFEGVRAALVDKDKDPKWQHRSIEDVPDALVDSYFEPIGADLDVVAERSRLL